MSGTYILGGLGIINTNHVLFKSVSFEIIVLIVFSIFLIHAGVMFYNYMSFGRRVRDLEKCIEEILNKKGCER